jgi:hypothetical protein
MLQDGASQGSPARPDARGSRSLGPRRRVQAWAQGGDGDVLVDRRRLLDRHGRGHQVQVTLLSARIGCMAHPTSSACSTTHPWPLQCNVRVRQYGAPSFARPASRGHHTTTTACLSSHCNSCMRNVSLSQSQSASDKMVQLTLCVFMLEFALTSVCGCSVNASLSVCAMAIVKTCTADLSIHQLWPQAHSHRFAPLLCSSTSFDHTGLTLGATRAGVKVDEDSVTALGQKLSAVGIGIAMIILSAHLNMGSLCFSTSGKRINSTPPSHASLAQSPAVQRAVTLIVFSLSSRWRQHNHCRTTLSCFHVSFFNATDHSSRVANWYLAHDCTHRVRWSQD